MAKKHGRRRSSVFIISTFENSPSTGCKPVTNINPLLSLKMCCWKDTSRSERCLALEWMRKPDIYDLVCQEPDVQPLECLQFEKSQQHGHPPIFIEQNDKIVHTQMVWDGGPASGWRLMAHKDHFLAAPAANIAV